MRDLFVIRVGTQRVGGRGGGARKLNHDESPDPSLTGGRDLRHDWSVAGVVPSLRGGRLESLRRRPPISPCDPPPSTAVPRCLTKTPDRLP